MAFNTNNHSFSTETLGSRISHLPDLPTPWVILSLLCLLLYLTRDSPGASLLHLYPPFFGQSPPVPWFLISMTSKFLSPAMTSLKSRSISDSLPDFSTWMCNWYHTSIHSQTLDGIYLPPFFPQTHSSLRLPPIHNTTIHPSAQAKHPIMSGVSFPHTPPANPSVGPINSTSKFSPYPSALYIPY